MLFRLKRRKRTTRNCFLFRIALIQQNTVCVRQREGSCSGSEQFSQFAFSIVLRTLYFESGFLCCNNLNLKRALDGRFFFFLLAFTSFVFAFFLCRTPPNLWYDHTQSQILMKQKKTMFFIALRRKYGAPWQTILGNKKSRFSFNFLLVMVNGVIVM